MKAFWDTIESEDLDESYERIVDLIGDLYFSPKTKVGEIKLESIELDDLSRLFCEIEGIPTIEDESLLSELNVVHLSILEEAAIRRSGAAIAWRSVEKQLKKKFF